ncbi:MAG: response regulator [Candidatus Zixiibacteriota bacterium]
MVEVVTTVAAPLLVVLIFGFLIYRFGFFTGRDIGGRLPFVVGGVLLLVVSLWGVVELAPNYTDWFIAGAYPLIDLAQSLLGAIGLLLGVSGLALYADYWQERRTEVEERFGRLSILDNLQLDSRQPYHLLEMLNISLREILVQYPMAAGAVLLVNRAQRQFVLTSSAGLHKDEIACLEYYPLGRNVVSQAVELGDPMLLAQFEFFDRTGGRIDSRFKSVLVLPLLSGMEQVGGLLLFSEEPHFFVARDIRYLAPVAQWLAEKIKSARLGRLLAQAERLRETEAANVSDLTGRVASSARAAAGSDPANGFCRSLVGLADSESVHLCGIRQGALVFHGSSEPLFDLTENLRASMIEGIDRARPLIINQESGDAEVRKQVVQSNLVLPVPGSKSDALLLVKPGPAFTVNDKSLKLIESFAALGGLVIRMEEDNRLRLTRRKGFEVVVELLRAELPGRDSRSGVRFFLETLGRVLPRKTICLAFFADSASSYRVQTVSPGENAELFDDILVHSGRGGAGAVAASGESTFIHGRGAVARHFDTYDDQVRSTFQRFFGERGWPEYVAYCPVGDGESTTVAMIAAHVMDESERAEWERLLTLAAGLCTLRLTTARLSRAGEAGVISVTWASTGDALNRLNNHLAAVIGTAELTAQDSQLSEDVRRRLRDIITRAEEAADVARRTLTAGPTGGFEGAGVTETVSRVVERELAQLKVSGNVHMAGQRPREIFSNLETVPPMALPANRLAELFRTLLDRFSALADEDDIFTIATYSRDKYVYLDVSRHRRNFPPVAPVAGFGRYVAAEEALRSRPSDIFLTQVQESGTGYAVDDERPVPAYLSFRFPVSPTIPAPLSGSPTPRARLLAIDDQQVILDLISAMGQSLGYEVRTASSGEEGLRLAERQQFDAVLTDLALPKMSGLEVARQISRLRPGVPVILVTGWSTELNADQLAEAGISDVLYKPFRMEQLTSVVRAVVAGRAGA